MSHAPTLTRLELARVGFAEPSRAFDLLHEQQTALSDVVCRRLTAFSTAADPDTALTEFIGIAERHPAVLDVDEAAFTRLLRLIGGSLGLSEFLLRDPAELHWFLTHDESPLNRDEYRESLVEAVAAARYESATGPCATPASAAHSVSAAALALRTRYRRHIAQLAHWDFATPDPRDVVARVSVALADLADAAVDAALQLAREECRSQLGDRVDHVRIAVIAMGKTGARELNYLSDVDVIYVAEPVDDADPTRALVTATRIVQSMMRIISAGGVEPGLWEVDANLRPEGKDGALVRTVASHLAYYERWAKGWEFQALLKARAMAGDVELGREYIDSIRPMVWQSARQENFVESVQAMRERVSDHIPPEQVARQIKLGPGGLRDVEFTVQLLQLVHGQHDERVRARGTLEALRQLADNGYIGRREAEDFAQDYRTLRVFEHRLQVRRMRRTHLMPTDPEELRILARSSRLAADADELLTVWTEVKRSVRDLHTRIFYSPLLAAVARIPGADFQLTEQHARERLSAIGYRDPAGALDRITALTTGVSRRAEIQRHLLPLMLELFAEGTDPDFGLLAFTRVSESIGEAYWYLRMLRDSPVAARRFAVALSRSRFIGDALASQPEAAKWFDDDDGVQPRTFEVMRHEMLAIVARHPKADDRVVALLQQVRRREVLRLAIWSVVHEVPAETISPALSDIYRALLTALLEWLDTEERFGVRLAVIGLGRFGGAEIGFSSDLDVMYVYEAVHERPNIRAAAQALGKAVQDFRMPVELDLDLRPEGRKGAIARTPKGLAAYYERWAEPWERHALLRAAPVAGDPELLDRSFASINAVRWERPLTRDDERQIKRLKARMESERLPRGVDSSRHVKLGRGSLTDVEWIVQLYQLRLAAHDTTVRTTHTLAALSALETAEAISQSDAETLRHAWLLASRVRDANILATGTASDVLAEPGSALEPTARVLGYASGQSARLDNDYLRATRRSRRVFERLFYGE